MDDHNVIIKSLGSIARYYQTRLTVRNSIDENNPPDPYANLPTSILSAEDLGIIIKFCLGYLVRIQVRMNKILKL